MERSTRCLLLIHLLLAPPAHLSVKHSSQMIPQFSYISAPRTWPKAQSYCRKHHTDLVTIRNAEQAELLSVYEGWIGLYLAPDEKWKWSKGDEIANFWKFDMDRVARPPPGPNPKGGPHHHELCAMQSGSMWKKEECNHQHAFLCTSEKLILVQEEKTWEEALLHCRQLQTPSSPRFDLASLSGKSKPLLDKETLRLNSNTDEVWVGLRFLAGEWMWMNREAVTSSELPHCPDEEEHCGALAHMNLQIMRCTERRNFLCSINT